MRSDSRAFFSNWFFGDLNENFLSFTEQVGNRRLISLAVASRVSGAAAAASFASDVVGSVIASIVGSAAFVSTFVSVALASFASITFAAVFVSRIIRAAARRLKCRFDGFDFGFGFGDDSQRGRVGSLAGQGEAAGARETQGRPRGGLATKKRKRHKTEKTYSLC